MNIIEFKKFPLIGIVRGVTQEALEPLLEAVIAGGLKTIEITMNTEGAADLIKEAIKLSNGRLTIGAGTVLHTVDLRVALDSGATFIVSPVLVPDVVKACHDRKVPVFPGALTPQEIYNAWEAGATMVKVFPAQIFGPAYFKEVKGPFDKIELLACGGVRPQNVQEFLSNGASAVAFGGSVFSRERFLNKQFKAIEADVRLLADAVKKVK
jgi:2-dehydro-3-deoxyphosphogluconate aldolase/(4S)-4-hydroxy-2-oxoglutarate aldolase